jgi:hypothetical protein
MDIVSMFPCKICAILIVPSYFFIHVMVFYKIDCTSLIKIDVNP